MSDDISQVMSKVAPWLNPVLWHYVQLTDYSKISAAALTCQLYEEIISGYLLHVVIFTGGSVMKGWGMLSVSNEQNFKY